jgi:hypothetical protein
MLARATPDLLDRQFHRFRTLEDATGIDADETPQLKRDWSPWPEFGSARAEKARPR